MGYANTHVPATGKSDPLAGRLAALLDPCCLAPQRAQVVQLGPANVSPGHDLDLLDGRGVHRESTLDADAIADLADRERLAGAPALAADHDALDVLDPGPVTFSNPDVHLQGVAWPEGRNVRPDLCLLKLGNRGVHRSSSSWSSRARLRTRLSGLVAAKGSELARATWRCAGQWLSVCHIFPVDCETSFGKDLPIALVQGRTGQLGGEIRPVCRCSGQRLVSSPPCDRPVIAGQQHVGYLKSAPAPRPGVAGSFNQPGHRARRVPSAEGVIRGRLSIAKDARDQAGDCLDHHEHGRFATGEYVVTN